jgi:hypothetical protein
MLRERANLDTFEADLVVQIGEEYLSELAQIDNRARYEIRERYQVYDEQVDYSAIELSDGTTLADHAPLVTRSMYGTDSYYERIQKDGVIEKITSQREAAFSAHYQKLRNALGPLKTAMIEDLIHSDIEPKVYVTTLQ